jgi:RHS repeat-associated protein
VTNKWTSGTVNGTPVTFGYDGLGRRSFRQITTRRTDQWYDRTGLTLESSTTSGANATYLREPGGDLLSVFSRTSFNNVMADRQDSVIALVSTSGTITNSYTYDPWGTVIASSGSAWNPFTFHGTYREPALGMYLAGARYYQPASARFTQLDPHPKKLLTINRYAYAANDPVNSSDPSGLHEIMIGPITIGPVTIGPTAIGGDFTSGPLAGCDSIELGLGIGMIVGGTGTDVASGIAAVGSGGIAAAAAAAGILSAISTIMSGVGYVQGACD